MPTPRTGVTINGTHYPTWLDAEKATGLSKQTLRYRLKSGIPITAPLRTSRRANDSRKPYILNAFPPLVTKWLLDSTPKGTTVSEFIAAIMIDAYNDEGQPYGPLNNHTATTEEP